MITALLLSAALVPQSCAGRAATLERVTREVKALPAYAGARNATMEVMGTADFVAEMALYHAQNAPRVLAFADPPMFTTYIRIDYLCVATEPELLQTVMHEFRHLLAPSDSERQVEASIYQNWPRRIGPPTADPTPRMKEWRIRHGR